MNPVQVVAGVIENKNGEVLLAERPPGKHLAGLWEFPGGKLEPDESPDEALVRELKEELHLDVKMLSRVGTFPFQYPDIAIELHVYHVRALSEPRVSADVLNFKWMKPQAIEYIELAPADIEPLRAFLALATRP